MSVLMHKTHLKLQKIAQSCLKSHKVALNRPKSLGLFCKISLIALSRLKLHKVTATLGPRVGLFKTVGGVLLEKKKKSLMLSWLFSPFKKK